MTHADPSRPRHHHSNLRAATALLAGLLCTSVTASSASASPSPVVEAQVEGGLDKPAIRVVVAAHIDEVRGCYNVELADQADVEGRIVVSLVIQPSGSASEVAITESTMPARFDACVRAAVEGWSFPSAATETQVLYPFVMSVD